VSNPRITIEEVEQLGRVVERLANLYGATKLPLRPELHLAGIVPGLKELRDQLRELYVAVSGDDPWEGDPSWGKP
jgi:hypothetical protein